MKKQLLSVFSLAYCMVSMTCAPLFAEAGHGGAMASCTQDLTPPKQIEMYLDGFHCLKSQVNLPAEKQLQIRAAHYCAHHNDMFMCSVYDGNGPNARLVAIEYVIKDDVYDKLPAAEKKYWHPHDVEVSTGLLRMPGLDADKEKATLAFLSGTHGKTWQVWPDLKNDLPVGEPVLLWSLDADKINSTTKKAVEQRTANPSY